MGILGIMVHGECHPLRCTQHAIHPLMPTPISFHRGPHRITLRHPRHPGQARPLQVSPVLCCGPSVAVILMSYALVLTTSCLPVLRLGLFGLVWFGLVWFGLVWSGLAWSVTPSNICPLALCSLQRCLSAFTC
ncbi:unnamed protein product [Chrysoparadoxa australica]